MYLFRAADFIERIFTQYIRTDGSVQCSIDNLIIGVNGKIRHSFSFRTVFCCQVVDVTLAKRFVYHVHRDGLCPVCLENIYGFLYLVSILLATLGLIFHICLHPVQQVNLGSVCLLFDACFAIDYFDDAFRLNGIGRSECGLVLHLCIVIGFRD